MSQSNQVIGYRVQSRTDGMFVHVDGCGNHFLSYMECAPIARPDAHRRLAGFFDQTDSVDEFDVVPVYQ